MGFYTFETREGLCDSRKALEIRGYEGILCYGILGLFFFYFK